jgi:hypothetical protein
LRKKNNKEEAELQTLLISYLSMYARVNKFIFFAPLNEALMTVLTIFKVPKETVYRIMAYFNRLGFLKGVPDILIFKAGRVFCLELKTEKGVQSDGQILFEKNCVRCGVPYLVGRSFEECQRILKEWGIV